VILLLAAEPLFWAVAHRAGGVASFDFQPSLAVSIGEALVGVTACACLAFVLRRAQPPHASGQRSG